MTEKGEFMIEFEVRFINPEDALILLASQRRNRNISGSYVRQLAGEMNNDRWRLTGEPIKIDEDNCLVDGQHRLQACVLANKGFETVVATGVLADNQDMMDLGKKRTAANALQMHGMTDANNFAAAARLIMDYKSGRLERGKGYSGQTNSAVVQFAMNNIELENALSQARIFKNSPLLQKSVATAAYYIFMEKDPGDTNAFMKSLAEGTGLETGNPILALRERLTVNQMQMKRKGAYIPAHMKLMMLIYVWNLYRRDLPLTQLKLLGTGSGALKFTKAI